MITQIKDIKQWLDIKQNRKKKPPMNISRISTKNIFQNLRKKTHTHTIFHVRVFYNWLYCLRVLLIVECRTRPTVAYIFVIWTLLIRSHTTSCFILTFLWTLNSYINMQHRLAKIVFISNHHLFCFRLMKSNVVQLSDDKQK